MLLIGSTCRGSFGKSLCVWTEWFRAGSTLHSSMNKLRDIIRPVSCPVVFFVTAWRHSICLECAVSSITSHHLPQVESVLRPMLCCSILQYTAKTCTHAGELFFEKSSERTLFLKVANHFMRRPSMKCDSFLQRHICAPLCALMAFLMASKCSDC